MTDVLPPPAGSTKAVEHSPCSADITCEGPVGNKDALTNQLDELLGEYLNTLDQYQQAQQQLTSTLSSGFLSLAQANFSNQSHSHYGQDYYDQRMQASRRISVGLEDSTVSFTVCTPDPDFGPEHVETDSPTDSESSKSDPPAKEEVRSLDEKDADTASPPHNKTRSDPIRWFGILVPPALRNAQSSFTSATEGPVPRLASLSKEMRRLEGDVSRLRKQIKRL